MRFIRSKGLNSRSAIFLGNKNSFKFIKKQINDSPWIGYKIIYWFSPNKKDYKNQNSNKEDFHCSGGINELLKTVREEKYIDKIYFSHDDNDEIKFNNILRVFGDMCIPVSYVIDWNANSLSLKKEYLGDIVALNIWNPGNSLFNEKIKRTFDLFTAIFILILLSPLFIVISILIRTSSPGPIIFKQKRYGQNGELFSIYKFRTMYLNQEKNQKTLRQVSINDKRITKLGKMLRKYSIDEIPQLFNVVKGEMSLVGPRPHAIQHNEYYRKLITGYMQRHSKLPGMTGLAQINGARGETPNIESMKKRIKYDIEYNNNWHLGKDIIILFKTILVLLKGEAY